VKNSRKTLASIFSRKGIDLSGQAELTQSTGLQPHVRLFILIALTVFVCETMVTFILSKLSGFHPWFHAVFDAALLVVLLSPVIYFGLLQTLMQYISELRRAGETIKKQRDNLENEVNARTADLSGVNARLKQELTKRKRVQEALQDAKEELERRVKERTVELQQANEKLTAEAQERVRFQEQLEHSKSMLQAVVDGISDPLVLIGSDMKIRMLNRAAAAYYGVSRYTEIIGTSCHQALRDKPAPCEGCEIPAALSDGKSLVFERHGFMEPERLERVFVYSVKEKRGQEDDVLLRISDITEQRLLEKQIIQSEKMASLGVMVSSIAHEINNPVNFISFNIPILRDYVTELLPIVDTYAREHPDFEIGHMPYCDFRVDIFKLLANIEHGSGRITNFISNLKDFSQVKDKFKEDWVDLNVVIAKMLSICRVQLKKSVKSLITKIPDNPPRIWTDPSALEQILLNLMVNAAQAAEKEDSRIELSVEINDSWLDHIVFEVSDNGSGMDQKTMQKIFDPFFTTKSGAGGTGLGLYVTHNLVESLRGRIEVESEAGKGSTFRVILPDRERRSRIRS